MRYILFFVNGLECFLMGYLGVSSVINITLHSLKLLSFKR